MEVIFVEKEVNEINWEEILNKFASYDGVITEFCKSNGISPHQLFYRRKKLRKESQTNFHPIVLNEKMSSEPNCDSNLPEIKDIRIEIGKATLFIPSNEVRILSDLVKELVKSC
jgi:transposase-like protein